MHGNFSCAPPPIHLLGRQVQGCLSTSPMITDQFLVRSLLNTGAQPKYQCTLTSFADIFCYKNAAVNFLQLQKVAGELRL